MVQLELDFDAIPGVVRLSPYLTRHAPKRGFRHAAANVLAFPLSRQRSTIQEVALRFKATRGKRRQAFWQETIARLREDLRRTGMSEAAIKQQLFAFRDAVEHELCPNHQDPRFGGAA